MPTLSNPLQVVDISKVNEATGEDLFNAAATQGFLFVEGHGFSDGEVKNLFEISKNFFDLPVKDKSQFVIDESNHGYTGFSTESLDPTTIADPKEGFNFAALDLTTGESAKGYPSWFEEDPKRADAIKSAIVKLAALNARILKLLAIGLKVEDTAECKGEDWFDSKYRPDKPNGVAFRLLHYPGQKKQSPEAQIRAGAHTDFGSITLLFQQENQEGLEIHSPVSKAWEPVPFVKNDETKFPGQAPPIVVNIADQLSYWTAGILKSTVHRVKFPAKVQETGQDRYSIVYFSNPNDDARLEPLPSPITRAVKDRGANSATTTLTAKEHLAKRLKASYKQWK